MRKLKTSDIPAFCRLIKALGLKNKIKEMAGGLDKNTDMNQLGMDLIFDILGGMTDEHTEAMVYGFLGGVFEMDPKDVADLELPALLESFKAFAKMNDLAAFFNYAVKWTK